jgi:pyruvate,orthophosphate dikinase
MAEKKYVYFFGNGKAEGRGDMKDLLGGKGAGLAEMTNVGLPVPPGFTISTEACNAYYAAGKKFPEGMWEQTLEALHRVEATTGKTFGGAENPLLVSVRSGAKFSMPGMMDTVLNLGLNETTLRGLIALTANERFGYDAYRRFIQMFGRIVLGIKAEKFDHLMAERKKKVGAKVDFELSAGDLGELCSEFLRLVREATGKDFPTDPLKQLDLAIQAVFASWFGKRAVDYRRINKIPDDLGTAVSVVTMVFGNMGADSGTGVAFTRDPATGEKELYGEYLQNAQGEDVVAGIVTPKKIAQLKTDMPEIYTQLERAATLLEKHYRDVQDMEFTVERGKFWMLQTRNAKRTGAAAVKIAVDMVHEGLIDKRTAILRVEPVQLDQLLHPTVDPKADVKVLATGLPASPGAATGKVVFDPDEAETLAQEGEKVVLVRIETSPEDYHGMVAAQAILTARGGQTSHAAVVARGMGKTCVAGCGDLQIDYHKKRFSVNSIVVRQGDPITVDGSTGRVILGAAPVVDPQLGNEFKELMQWANELRRLKVRANADTPHDARVAREFGAEGIGLCRTEHMFFEGDRIDSVRRMILGSMDYKRLEARQKAIEDELSKSQSEDKKARLKKELKEIKTAIQHPKKLYLGGLQKLLPMQRKDFVGIFREMASLPVTIRTLDPPLHEFLPHGEKEIRALAEQLVDQVYGDKGKKLKGKDRQAKVKRLAKELSDKVDTLHEFNPMLGHRGCRLGIVYPEITEMQARAIFEAAVAVKKQGIDVIPEVMIPLVAYTKELKLQEDVVRRVAREVMDASGVEINYSVGTMIELPRAALTADEIANVAEFFSFGTNDLTQTTLGLSRDDAGKFLFEYQRLGIFEDDPFVVLDQRGVGQLVKMGVERGRATRPNLKVGICGEHGGEPKSVMFCHRTNLDYVSCSPYRVPIAILAAAQAAVDTKESYSTA